MDWTCGEAGPPPRPPRKTWRRAGRPSLWKFPCQPQHRRAWTNSPPSGVSGLVWPGHSRCVDLWRDPLSRHQHHPPPPSQLQIATPVRSTPCGCHHALAAAGWETEGKPRLAPRACVGRVIWGSRRAYPVRPCHAEPRAGDRLRRTGWLWPQRSASAGKDACPLLSSSLPTPLTTNKAAGNSNAERGTATSSQGGVQCMTRRARRQQRSGRSREPNGPGLCPIRASSEAGSVG